MSSAGDVSPDLDLIVTLNPPEAFRFTVSLLPCATRGQFLCRLAAPLQTVSVVAALTMLRPFAVHEREEGSRECPNSHACMI